MTYKPLLIMERTGLYLTVFLTGTAVMVIELLGTRLSCVYPRSGRDQYGAGSSVNPSNGRYRSMSAPLGMTATSCGSCPHSEALGLFTVSVVQKLSCIKSGSTNFLEPVSPVNHQSARLLSASLASFLFFSHQLATPIRIRTFDTHGFTIVGTVTRNWVMPSKLVSSLPPRQLSARTGMES